MWELPVVSSAETLQKSSDFIFAINLSQKHSWAQGFFKENVWNPVWICRDPISLILETRFSLILGTRC